ncbi:uncharacterized protein [Heptranchias perlo]|uniref:uncharacterized protein n=1 Tax=Heptranchias perlo TaxID=212740 RepID=UPI003559CC5E
MWLDRSQQAHFHCLLLIWLIQGNGNRACPLAAMYPRAMLTRTVGDSLTLNCTIKYCSDQAQDVEAHWCIMEASSCQPVTGNLIHSGNGKEKQIFVTHTIAFLNFSDSGTFRCHASQGALTTMGHSIVVNVTVASVTPVTPVGRANNTYKWSFLVFLPLLVVIICVILYYRVKRRSAQRRQRTQEKNVTAASSSPTVTMATTDATELCPLAPYVNKRRVEPL